MNRDVSSHSARKGGRTKVLSSEEVPCLELSDRPWEKAQPDQVFDRRWVEERMREGLEVLHTEMLVMGRERDYEIFALHDVNPPDGESPSYADLAGRFGTTEQRVKSSLSFTRGNLRRIIRGVILRPADQSRTHERNSNFSSRRGQDRRIRGRLRGLFESCIGGVSPPILCPHVRKKLIAGNWKMNLGVHEAVELVRSLRSQLDGVSDPEILVCPPFTVLAHVCEVLEGSLVGWGAQDLHWEDRGAFTGEISPTMLRDLGCTAVIVGHSERRHVIGESNEMVNKKVHAAARHGLTPILCVGELLEERSMGVAREVVERQVVRGLEGITAQQASAIVLAYEPVWAIGTGKTAKPEQAQEMHHFTRNLLSRLFGTATAQTMRVLYGGSVTPENARSLMEQPDVDGALVGGASLESMKFVRIVRYREAEAKV